VSSTFFADRSRGEIERDEHRLHAMHDAFHLCLGALLTDDLQAHETKGFVFVMQKSEMAWVRRDKGACPIDLCLCWMLLIPNVVCFRFRNKVIYLLTMNTMMCIRAH
jgi:hypothetical protein